jgi:hypothetical protein
MRSVNSPRLLGVLAAALVVSVAVWYALNLYTTPNPWKGYAKSITEFFRAAQQNDSAGVDRLAASPALAAWALNLGSGPASPVKSLGQLLVINGRRAADSTLVVFQIDGGECHGQTLTAVFVGVGSAERVSSVEAPCLRRR